VCVCVCWVGGVDESIEQSRFVTSDSLSNSKVNPGLISIRLRLKVSEGGGKDGVGERASVDTS